MSTRQQYLEFAPPPTPGLLRGLVLAIMAHGMLLAMLAVGVHWQRDAPIVTAQAELWSTIPQEAAPAPAPIPEPVEEPEAPIPPPPPVRPTPPIEKPAAIPPPLPDPAIALAREKTRALKEKQLADKLAAEKAEKAKAQKRKEAELALEKAAAEKLAADKKRQQDVAKSQERAIEAKKLAELRQQNLKRMASLAGTGSDSSQGAAAQSSGPSAGYAGRIRARIKPNITFTETPVGNPLAEVEVRTSPDGTVISRRLTQSSGLKAWDDAVLAAIDKTEVLPRDVDGRVPPVLIIGFRPRD